MNACLLLLAAPTLLVCVGCATFKTGTVADYDQGQASGALFAKDAEICAKLSEDDQKKLGAGGEIDLTHATYNRMFDACMRASGYKRKPEP